MGVVKDGRWLVHATKLRVRSMSQKAATHPKMTRDMISVFIAQFFASVLFDVKRHVSPAADMHRTFCSGQQRRMPWIARTSNAR